MSTRDLPSSASTTSSTTRKIAKTAAAAATAAAANSNSFTAKPPPPCTVYKTLPVPKKKMFASLHTRKGRKENNKVIVEGYKCMRDIKLYGDGLTPEVLIGLSSDVIPLVDLHGPNTVLYSLEAIKKNVSILNSLSATKTPCGLYGVYSLPIPRPVRLSPKTFFLILNNLTDSGNVGTIIRTYNSLPYTGGVVGLEDDSIDFYDSKVIRSSMGTVGFGCNVYRKDKVEDLITFMDDTFGEGEWKIGVASLPDKNATKLGGREDCREVETFVEYNDPSNKSLRGLILGSEATGPSSNVKKLTEIDERFVKVYIKMEDKCESLNVAVAGGIIMYEVARLKGI